MGRLNLETAIPSLDELIPQYAIDKSQLDALKKVCDSANAIIKEQMFNQATDTYTAGGYTAKRTVSVRETLNEERLIAAAPNIGFNSQPKRFTKTPAASGIPIAL
jgi:hypothetical protein